MQKILYVEDDLSLIDGLKYTLENSGYFVDNARTASEALARFKQDTYDLLLLDVTLPDGTGFDVCKEVRAISTIPMQKVKNRRKSSYNPSFRMCPIKSKHRWPH